MSEQCLRSDGHSYQGGVCTFCGHRSSIIEGLQAVYEAGGDGWDHVADPAEYLGRKDVTIGADELAELRRKAAKGEALADAIKAYVEWYGLKHKGDCPEDDTCDCHLVLDIDKALTELAAVQGKEGKS